MNPLEKSLGSQGFQVAASGSHAHGELGADVRHRDALVGVQVSQNRLLPFDAGEGEVSIHDKDTRKRA